ncbi:MAG TPA: nuclear transport factor 2 family protein, partial [Gemmatimonadota bacterium]|nr:nuclear transport factor 2 family protein [Gemmatimonadota bacterium]
MIASARSAFAAAVFVLGAATSGIAQEAPSEEAAVRAALEHYLLGHATGDGAHFAMVFHPESKAFLDAGRHAEHADERGLHRGGV